MRNFRRCCTRAGWVAFAAALPAVAGADICSVPSVNYPTIGAAVRAVACTTVTISAGTFPENVEIARDLAVQGAGSAATFVQGRFVVSGAGVDVTLNALQVDGTTAGVAGCGSEILAVSGGAILTSGSDLRVLQAAGGGACRLFVDGFESGGTLAWSAQVP
jgi:hypothetical protein